VVDDHLHIVLVAPAVEQDHEGAEGEQPEHRERPRRRSVAAGCLRRAGLVPRKGQLPRPGVQQSKVADPQRVAGEQQPAAGQVASRQLRQVDALERPALCVERV
jgi:hypothetical protein